MLSLEGRQTDHGDVTPSTPPTKLLYH